MSGKALKKLAIGAAVIGLAVATGGISITPTLAASAGVGGIGAFAAVAGGLSTTFLGGLALSFGASQILGGVAGALAKGPKASPSQLSALNLTLNPSEPRKWAFGYGIMSPDVRYVEPSGTDQEYFDYIIAVAAHRVTSIEEIWFEDLLAWHPASGGVLGKYVGYLTVTVRLEGAAANTIAINGGTNWGTAQRLTGCAYLHIRVKRTGNTKKAESPLAGGLPSRITIVGKKAPVYDPRHDSTAGGSGPQRAADRSTWAFNHAGGVQGYNPALQILSYLLGYTINGKLSVGRGVPAARIDMASFITAANLCEELVHKADGGYVTRYVSCGIASEADDPDTVLGAILTACNGRLRDGGGKLSLAIMHNDLAGAAADAGLNDDDVLSGFMWNPDASLEQSYNVVRGRYTDPSASSLYQAVDYPEVSLPSVDGVERVLPLDLLCVQDAAQAQRIAKQVLQRKQYDRSFSATFGANAWRYSVGDIVPFTFAALAFGRRLFRVEQQTINVNGTCEMVLTEENAAIYAWDDEETAAVQPAEPVRYDSRNNPLILGIEQAGTTANWSVVADDGGKPDDNADVTTDVLDAQRYQLTAAADRIGTEVRRRFDPIFWTCNFPNTMMASLRASPGELRLDAVFHEKDHLAGVIWESVDLWDHPTTGFDTNRDYRGCVLTFRVQLSGDVQPLDAIDAPVLTIEGRKADGTAHTWFVRLGNAATSGGPTDAIVELDFDALPGGYYGYDSVYAGDVDRMFISLVPVGYDTGGGRLSAPKEGGMVLSEMTATGAAATMVCGLGPGGVHEVRMTNGYDDSYNVAPARILRNLTLLGYKEVFNHYVGMSHYFRWDWDDGENRYVAQDVDEPLNTPCTLWHQDLAERLHAAGIELIVSLSYEMLNSFMPAVWRQRDHLGEAALTGWDPPSSLFSPCNVDGMAYLTKVARQFCDIAATAGQPVHFQVGEPWYWIDFRTQVPCFYDDDTTAKYLADTGLVAPSIEVMTEPMNAAKLAYLNWLGEQLAASIVELVAAVRNDHAAMTSYVLLYLPQVLDAATPEVQRVNMPVALAYPALDVLQVEDYDFVIENRVDLSATGRARVEARLGYPRSKQQYFGGFALFRDTGQIWRNTSNAMQAAYDHGVFPVFVWAYTQVLRDGYVPSIRMAPAACLADLIDVDLTPAAADGDVLFYSAELGRWVPGKPWLA